MNPVPPRPPVPSPRRIPEPVVRRLSIYLRHLDGLRTQNIKTLSSKQLGDALALTDAQVRKDLGVLGALGHPGIGYSVENLIERLRHALGTDHAWNVVVIGAGNLGRALASYHGFAAKEFRLTAVFDLEAGTFNGVEVQPMARLAEIVSTCEVRLALMAVPTEAAQGVVDLLADAGVRGVLNFAPVTVTPPDGMDVVNVDLAVQLEQLAYLVGKRDHSDRRGGD